MAISVAKQELGVRICIPKLELGDEKKAGAQAELGVKIYVPKLELGDEMKESVGQTAGKRRSRP